MKGLTCPLPFLPEASKVCPSEWTFAVIEQAVQNSNLIHTGPLLATPTAVGTWCMLRSARGCGWQDKEVFEQEFGAESVVVTVIMVTIRSRQATQLVGMQKLLEGPGKSQ